MPRLPNITNIPAPRVNFIDDRTGLMSREWYRFFLNLFTLTGGGSNSTSLEDLQLGPAFEITPNMFVIDNPSPDAESSIATLSMSVNDLGQSLQTLPMDFGGTVSSVNVTLATTGTDVSFSATNSTTAPVIALNIPTASASNRGALSAADWTTFNNKGSGTVTGVTGTAPVVSSGGTAPAISMAAASTTVDGYLTAANFTTFNNKGSGSVTSVAQTFTGGLISVGGSPITTSGTLALTVAGTSGGVPYFTSASTWASSAVLAANALMVGGGAGLTPATVTTGSGVVTALGVNVGTAGAVVVNGGALGTPSSGTVTNLTGTASININGTVGATTANTGAFTSLSYTTTLTGGTGIVNLGSGQFYKDASGNVGIGTITPSTYGKLAVVGTGTVTANIVGDSTSETQFKFFTNTAARISNQANTPLIFDTNATERMRLDNSGNLGVGTSAAYGGRINVVPATSPTTVAGANQIQIGEATANTAYRMQLGYFLNGAAYNGSIQVYNNSLGEKLILNGAGGDVVVAGSGGLGYGTGSGGSVTQLTSRTTGVTLNKTNGAITMFSAAGSAVAATFTVTNSTVAATDVVYVSVKTATNVYLMFVTATAAGSFNITFQTTGGVSTDAPVINFAVIKAVTA